MASSREDEDHCGHTVEEQKSKKIHVDLVMEMFNSFRSKPMEMLTFLCAQDFRRDEFIQHYSAVHCDIQTGRYCILFVCMIEVLPFIYNKLSIYNLCDFQCRFRWLVSNEVSFSNLWLSLHEASVYHFKQ